MAFYYNGGYTKTILRSNNNTSDFINIYFASSSLVPFLAAHLHSNSYKPFGTFTHKRNKPPVNQTAATTLISMARTSRSRSPSRHSTTLTIRTREPSARDHASEEQRRRIAENDAVLRQLGDLEPKVGNLSIHPKIPRGDELTIQEEMSVIYGGATPAQYSTTHELLLEQQRQDIIDNTSPISPVFPDRFGQKVQNQAEQVDSLEYDDFPELNAKYGLTPATKTSHNLTPTISLPSYPTTAPHNGSHAPDLVSDSTDAPVSQYSNRYYNNCNSLCIGPCPLKFPHNQGPYLQQGLVPRVWNPKWGYSDPPKRIWDAFVRNEQGRGSDWDQAEVEGFAVAHWWDGL